MDIHIVKLFSNAKTSCSFIVATGFVADRFRPTLGFVADRFKPAIDFVANKFKSVIG